MHARLKVSGLVLLSPSPTHPDVFLVAQNVKSTSLLAQASNRPL